jgi:Flp pilus assembly protein TadD
MSKPSQSSRHLHRGASLHRKGHAAAAIREYERHVATHPDDKMGHYHLALVLEECGRPDAAVCEYSKALEIDSYYPEALNNLGILLHRKGNLHAARTCFARALASRPDYVDAEYNYATAESDAGNHQAALLHFSRVLERDPKRVAAWNNLAKLFLDLREPGEAVRACQIALAIDNKFADTRWNKAVADLTLGHLPEGWGGFEFRGVMRHQHIPRWNGEELDGKRLLIHAEQGIGDALQFVRYCSHVPQNHVLECHPEILSLLNNTIRECLPFGTPLPAVDYQIPLMSLPGLFATSLDNIPDQMPYLKADAALVEEWNRRLITPDHSRKVGLVWAGNPAHRNDRNRSIEPALLEGLAATSRVSFICLQQRPQSTYAAATQIPFAGVFDQLSWPDTAAILMNLDLLITVDTAVAHLAGALARPVWTLLPYAPDWRWMLDRTDTPWYPTMRLFRQPRLNDWASVLADVAAALREVPFSR